MLTATTINAAAHLANINAKGLNLVNMGYTIAPFFTVADLFYVDTPKGDTYFTCITEGATHCTCKGFETEGVCSHVIGCEEEARLLALVADYDARDENYTLPAPVAPACTACPLCGTAALWSDTPDATCATCEGRALSFC